MSDALLKDLVEHFSKLPLGNHNVTSDLLGDAYECLIKKFADATNKKAGEFYTPRSVVRLMIDMLDPKEAETIYDPACGTGGMLLATATSGRTTDLSFGPYRPPKSQEVQRKRAPETPYWRSGTRPQSGAHSEKPRVVRGSGRLRSPLSRFEGLGLAEQE